MNHLPGCMYTGIRSTCTDHGNRMIGYTRQGPLDASLNGASFCLSLPAKVIRTIILDAKGDTHTDSACPDGLVTEEYMVTGRNAGRLLVIPVTQYVV
jgi:hypothetical protein